MTNQKASKKKKRNREKKNNARGSVQREGSSSFWQGSPAKRKTPEV
jgi:hypothetical protein